MNAVDLDGGQTTWKILFVDEQWTSVWENIASHMNVDRECVCMLRHYSRVHTYFRFPQRTASRSNNKIIQMEMRAERMKVTEKRMDGRTDGRIKLKSKWKTSNKTNTLWKPAHVVRWTFQNFRQARTEHTTPYYTYPAWNAGICIIKSTIHRECYSTQWAILIK